MGGPFLALQKDFSGGSAVFQRIVLRPAICVQGVVGAVVDLPALIVVHLALGLPHDLPNFIADLHKFIVPVVGINPPQIDGFIGLPPENGRGGQLVRCPPPAGIREQSFHLVSPKTGHSLSLFSKNFINFFLTASTL